MINWKHSISIAEKRKTFEKKINGFSEWFLENNLFVSIVKRMVEIYVILKGNYSLFGYWIIVQYVFWFVEISERPQRSQRESLAGDPSQRATLRWYIDSREVCQCDWKRQTRHLIPTLSGLFRLSFPSDLIASANVLCTLLHFSTSQCFSHKLRNGKNLPQFCCVAFTIGRLL